MVDGGGRVEVEEEGGRDGRDGRDVDVCVELGPWVEVMVVVVVGLRGFGVTWGRIE